MSKTTPDLFSRGRALFCLRSVGGGVMFTVGQTVSHRRSCRTLPAASHSQSAERLPSVGCLSLTGGRTLPSADLPFAHNQLAVSRPLVWLLLTSNRTLPSADLPFAHNQPAVFHLRVWLLLTSNRTLPSAALPFAHNQPAVSRPLVWLLLTSNRTLPSVGLPVCPSRVP